MTVLQSIIYIYFLNNHESSFQFSSPRRQERRRKILLVVAAFPLIHFWWEVSFLWFLGRCIKTWCLGSAIIYMYLDLSLLITCFLVLSQADNLLYKAYKKILKNKVLDLCTSNIHFHLFISSCVCFNFSALEQKSRYLWWWCSMVTKQMLIW